MFVGTFSFKSTFFTGWTFPKSSPWKEEIDKSIRMLIEAGLVDQYKREDFFLTKKKFMESDEEKIIFVEPPAVAPMNMHDLQGLFYVLGVGLAFSLITYLIEVLIGLNKRSQIKVTSSSIKNQ